MRLGAIPHGPLYRNAAPAAVPNDTYEIRLPACCISAATSAIINLLHFSIFVDVRLLDSGPYRREKRVAGRRGMHAAG